MNANSRLENALANEQRRSSRLEREIEALKFILARAAYVARHLHAMIDQETWRATGGDDMQGHYEGDYHAEQVAAEIETWAAIAQEDGAV